MWKLYFYGELAADELCTLRDLATYIAACKLPEDLEWFATALIEWDAVTRGFIYRQFAGSGDSPLLTLVKGGTKARVWELSEQDMGGEIRLCS